MGKKVVSYCLFGNKLKYCHGIIEAVISSNLIFLGWEVRVYYSVGKQKVPQSVINILKNLNCVLIPFSEINTCSGEDVEGMMRRFEPFSDSEVDVWLSRDSDSRSSIREKKMIDEWLESDKTVHSILDHPCHGNLMGCNFGINNKLVRERYPEKLIDMKTYLPELAEKIAIRRGYDQNWIGDHFMNIMRDKKDVLVHLSNKDDCKARCHIGGIKPIHTNFPCILTEPVSNFCGKQINYSHSKLSRPLVEIEDIQLEGCV